MPTAEKPQPTLAYTTQPVDLLWALAIGVLGALAAYGFRMAMNGLHFLFTGHVGPFTYTAAHLNPWMRVLVPTIGGLLAGATLMIGLKLLRNRRDRDYMEAIRIGDGEVPLRPTLVKSLSSLFSISSGGSIGREGPMVQLAAMLASLPGRLLHFSDERRRMLVACGAASGIAAAYNTPIAGAMFVAEIALGSLAMDKMGPLLLSSVASTVIAHDLLGAKPIFEIAGLQAGSHGQIPLYMIVGLVAGLAAPGFVALLRGTQALFTKLPAPLLLKLGIGGLCVGLLSLVEPRVWGNGYSVVWSILHEPWLPTTLLIMLVLKLAATSATVGSGAVGGVFTPTLFVGATLGALVAALVQLMLPGQLSQTAGYALVGMGAFLAATTHAPMMAILLIVEVTRDYHMILPLTLSCVVAYFVAVRIDRRSIYEYHRDNHA